MMTDKQREAAALSSAKTLDDNFSDWEGHVFGFGYGSGEPHTIPALRAFLAAVPDSGCYDHRVLENVCGAAVAWLLINTLAHADIIEYGTSPRCGWLTEQGRALRSFVVANTVEHLVELANRGPDYSPCYPDACNCGPTGYVKGLVCANPFWRST